MTYRGIRVVCIGCWRARRTLHDPWRGHLEGCLCAPIEDKHIAAKIMRLARRGS